MQTFEGYVGVDWEDSGLYETKEKTEDCFASDARLFHDIFREFDCKKVKLTIEIIE